MYPAGRRVIQRALQGMNVAVAAAVCSLFTSSSLPVSFAFHPLIPAPLFHLASSVMLCLLLGGALHWGRDRRASSSLSAASAVSHILCALLSSYRSSVY